MRLSFALHAREQTGPTREIRLVAEVGDVELAPARIYRTWLYNGRFPGEEIRVREGERLQVVLENRLPEATTIYWHGIPVPNRMDEVPDVTQSPIVPGGKFIYDFVAGPAGRYLYHSHMGLQPDRGLIGTLVVEEATPNVLYDRECSVVFDDFLSGAPRPLTGGGARRGRGEMMAQGMMGRGMGMVETPDYAGLLCNGRLPEAAPVFEVKRGERICLRLMNPAAATTFRVAIAGHQLLVTHADGRPIEPVMRDALTIGMGERYDVIVEANNPWAWTLVAVPTRFGQNRRGR